MKWTRCVLYGLVAVFFAVTNISCTENEMNEGVLSRTTTLSITISSQQTRSRLMSDGSIQWSSSDFLFAFNNVNKRFVSSVYSSTSEENKFVFRDWATGTMPQYVLFDKLRPKASIEDDVPSISSEGLITTTLPHIQSPIYNKTFGRDANTSIGKVEKVNGEYVAELKNISGLLRIELDIEGIQSVSLSGNNGEDLAGRICVDYNDGNPKYIVDEGEKTILLNNRNSNGEYVKGIYYICVLPQSFQRGITLKFTNAEGYTATVASPASLSLARNGVIDLGKFGSNLTFEAEPGLDIPEIESPLDMDFSRVGYHFGEDEIPDYMNLYPKNIIYVSPKGNGASQDDDEIIDRYEDITNAINNVSKPGTVVLKAGRYYVSKQLRLPGQTVLRGETDSSISNPLERNLTTIISSTQSVEAASDKTELILMGCASSGNPILSTDGVAVVNEYVPEGAMCLRVEDASGFAVGDAVLVCRPDSDLWHSDIGMDNIVYDGGTAAWDSGKFNINAERYITAINENTLFFDNPLPMSLDSKYGTATVCHYTWKMPRYSESGIEYLNFDTLFDKSVISQKDGEDYFSDENHFWSAVLVYGAQHCWVKGITGSHFSFATVSLRGNARNITIEDCHSYEPVSQITGKRRYAFAIGRAQLNLFKNCTADKDRHQFVTTMVESIGPNVFVDCTATNSYSNAGPHANWSTCTLYDNIKTDELLSVEDAYSYGATHNQGWQGANQFFWNCESGSIICQSPQTSAKNWAWGCIGQKKWGSLSVTQNQGDRPEGQYNSHDAHIEPRSLYYYQLDNRMSKGTSLKAYINR